MAKEIERKFLVIGDAWRATARSVTVRQGFIVSGPGRVVRVRIAGVQATLTIKGPTSGIVRSEFEYDIPVADAEQLLEELCDKPLVEKVRHVLEVDGNTWQIDEFAGANAGLIVAEIELPDEDADVDPPAWIGAEVTGDPRYYNVNLVHHPYCEWGGGLTPPGQEPPR